MQFLSVLCYVGFVMGFLACQLISWPVGGCSISAATTESCIMQCNHWNGISSLLHFALVTDSTHREEEEERSYTMVLFIRGHLMVCPHFAFTLFFHHLCIYPKIYIVLFVYAFEFASGTILYYSVICFINSHFLMHSC